MPLPLTADRACIAVLDAQIPYLERCLAALRIEKAFVQKRLDSYRYPALTLPTEITSEIFMHFLPTYPLCSPLVSLLLPTLLTHICRKWRDIALAAPILWRAISLSGSNDLPCDHIHSVLDRSGYFPLSIQIDEHPIRMFPHESKLLAAVLPYCACWKYVELDLSGSSLPAIQGGMPLICDLAVDLDGYLTEDLVFHEVPLLRTVAVDIITSQNILLPWEQLTCLTLNSVSLYNSREILQQATNLVHCEMNLCASACNFPLLTDITLPYLESLCWNDIINNDPLPNCLDGFIVPAFRSLEFTEWLLHPNPINFLTSFISKSGCKVQELVITGQRSVRKHSYREAFPSIDIFSDGVYVGDHDSTESDSLDAN